MSSRVETILIREGRYVVEVQIEVPGPGGNAHAGGEHPVVVEVREALREGELTRAQRYGQVYEVGWE